MKKEIAWEWCCLFFLAERTANETLPPSWTTTANVRGPGESFAFHFSFQFQTFSCSFGRIQESHKHRYIFSVCPAEHLSVGVPILAWLPNLTPQHKNWGSSQSHQHQTLSINSSKVHSLNLILFLLIGMVHWSPLISSGNYMVSYQSLRKKNK